MDLINSPKTGDAERVDDVLHELHAVMRKHGFVLQHQPNGMVLGQVPPGLGTQVRVLAVVQLIAPDCYIAAKIDWKDGVIHPGEFDVTKVQ